MTWMNNKSQMKRVCMLAVLLLATASRMQSQVNYLASFDKEKLHFGIQLGYTQSKFEDSYTTDDDVRQLLYGTTSYYTPGFHIAVISDFRLGNYFNLRFLPGLTLISRNVDYSWSGDYARIHQGLERQRSVESAYGEIPIDLKFRAFRYGNFRPYLTVGGCYGFDFASLRNNKNNTNQSIIRLNSSDFQYTMGVGFDFYLRYVKFALELKVGFGLADLKIDDDDLYDKSLEFIRTRSFMIGFTFEGPRLFFDK